MTNGMKWTVLIALILLPCFYLLGMVSHDAEAQRHKQSMECLQAGGKMEPVLGNGPTCQKN